MPLSDRAAPVALFAAACVTGYLCARVRYRRRMRNERDKVDSLRKQILSLRALQQSCSASEGSTPRGGTAACAPGPGAASGAELAVAAVNGASLSPSFPLCRSPRKIRVWLDAVCDLMHFGHANAFRQGRLLGDILIVGVNSSSSVAFHKGVTPVMSDVERCTAVYGCRFVDAVMPNVPYVMDADYLNDVVFGELEVDFVVHGDDPCIAADGSDVYAEAKRMGKFRTVPRTEGVSSSDLVGRMLLSTRDHHVRGEGDGASTAPGPAQAAIVDGHVEAGAAGAPSAAQRGSHVVFATGFSASHASKFLATAQLMVKFSEGVRGDADGGPHAGEPLKLARAEPGSAAASRRAKHCATSLFRPTTPADLTAALDASAILPTDTVYVPGCFDMFSAGGVLTLRAIRRRCAKLVVGVFGDRVSNAVMGRNLPIMNIYERLLSVLSCKFVDDVVVDAPLETSDDMLATLSIDRIVVFDNEHTAGERPGAHHPREALTKAQVERRLGPRGLERKVELPHALAALTGMEMAQRVLSRSDSYAAKVRTKEAEEKRHRERKFGY